MKTFVFQIEGMRCDSCVLTVRHILQNAGAENVEVQVGRARFNATEAPDAYRKAIERAGYRVVAVKEFPSV